jgi:release factor glutamine methyltransferase
VADEPATQRRVAHLDAMVARRAAGEPVQYVLGRWPFRTLDLMVDRRVLIPRAETEVVAGLVIDLVNARGGARVADLGTGSGAIALSVAAECKHAQVWATDRSTDALDVARANCAGLGRRSAVVTLVEGSWFDALPAQLRGRLDVVVSNPPYVMADDPLPPSVRDWEPVEALRAGPDGLDDLRVIIDGAADWLSSDGVLVCEIDPRQAESVADLARSHGFAAVEVVADLAGRARALVAHRG